MKERQKIEVCIEATENAQNELHLLFFLQNHRDHRYCTVLATCQPDEMSTANNRENILSL